jgi:hypothetical protein
LDARYSINERTADIRAEKVGRYDGDVYRVISVLLQDMVHKLNKYGSGHQMSIKVLIS